MTGIKSCKWIAGPLALLLACSVTSLAVAQTGQAARPAPKISPEQAKALEDWTYSLAANAATARVKALL